MADKDCLVLKCHILQPDLLKYDDIHSWPESTIERSTPCFLYTSQICGASHHVSVTVAHNEPRFLSNMLVSHDIYCAHVFSVLEDHTSIYARSHFWAEMYTLQPTQQIRSMCNTFWRHQAPYLVLLASCATQYTDSNSGTEISNLQIWKYAGSPNNPKTFLHSFHNQLQKLRRIHPRRLSPSPHQLQQQVPCLVPHHTLPCSNAESQV